MAGAVAKALVAIEAQRQYFITNTDHSLKQADCFDKILELFKRDPRPDDKPSTRSRRKTAHRILTAVLQSLGFEAFLLCSFALSITALVEIKSPEEFIVKFREWQKSKEMPENLSTVARKYEDDYGRHLLQTDKHQGSIALRKRGFDDTEPEQEPPSDMQPAKRIVWGQTRQVRPKDGQVSDIYNDGDELEENGENGENDESDESDGSDGTNYGEDVDQPLVDAPLDGKVYSLQKADAIVVLAKAKEDLSVRLTMPKHPQLKPFITFHCSERWAMRYLTKRNQVM